MNAPSTEKRQKLACEHTQNLFPALIIIENQIVIVIDLIEDGGNE